MDLHCKRCMEPWDVDYIRDDVLPKVGPIDLWEAVTTAKEPTHSRGFVITPEHHINSCPACPPVVDKQTRERAAMYNAMAAVLGDDIDGLIAEFEDVEDLGWI